MFKNPLIPRHNRSMVLYIFKTDVPDAPMVLVYLPLNFDFISYSFYMITDSVAPQSTKNGTDCSEICSTNLVMVLYAL